jgi:hypothetical protein
VKLIAQTGPAGLGTTDGASSLAFCLKADQGVSEIDGKLQNWADLSASGRDFN